MSKERPLEYCAECGHPTGRAGWMDDSLYTDDDKGPFCKNCFPLAEKACAELQWANSLVRNRPGLNDLVEQLCTLTRNWKSYEYIPPSQREECWSIGEAINALGGRAAMVSAYYIAKSRNPAVHVIQAYWGGIGDWHW